LKRKERGISIPLDEEKDLKIDDEAYNALDVWG